MKTITIELTDKEYTWLDTLTARYNGQVPQTEVITHDEMAAIYLSLVIEDAANKKHTNGSNQ